MCGGDVGAGVRGPDAGVAVVNGEHGAMQCAMHGDIQVDWTGGMTAVVRGERVGDRLFEGPTCDTNGEELFKVAGGHFKCPGFGTGAEPL
mmetsp:Transcript_51113/g.136417  ORF Transcript_51113/g.136417 Transcript_51113/m.136417 type:complete len:90 (-) Transcript_51113:127-396(-)